MTTFASLILLILPLLCQSIGLAASWDPRAVAFIPRGGAIGGRKGRSKVVPSSNKEDPNAAALPAESEEDIADGNDTGDSFDLQEVSTRIHKEEVAEIKKTQQFLQKQQRRRELDLTFLDKGITAFIEFFENLFRWEVIEV